MQRQANPPCNCLPSTGPEDGPTQPWPRNLHPNKPPSDSLPDNSCRSSRYNRLQRNQCRNRVENFSPKARLPCSPPLLHSPRTPPPQPHLEPHPPLAPHQPSALKSLPPPS